MAIDLGKVDASLVFDGTDSLAKLRDHGSSAIGLMPFTFISSLEGGKEIGSSNDFFSSVIPKILFRLV